MNIFLRPVLTAGIIPAGAVGHRGLPVSALPVIDHPAAQVGTFPPGEREFGLVPGSNHMTCAR